MSPLSEALLYLVWWSIFCSILLNAFVANPEKVWKVKGEKEFLRIKEIECRQNAKKHGKFSFLFEKR